MRNQAPNYFKMANMTVVTIVSLLIKNLVQTYPAAGLQLQEHMAYAFMT